MTFGELPLLKWAYVHCSTTADSLLEALVYKTKQPSRYRKQLTATPPFRNFAILTNMLLGCPMPMERCEINVELQVLRLNNCYYVSSDDVKRLEKAVVDVIWDEQFGL